MGGPSVRTPRGKNRTPGRRSVISDAGAAATPDGSQRKRRRASDFASKSPSVRKRKRTRDEDGESQVDKMILRLRNLLEDDDADGDHEELREAFERAKDAAQKYDSGSSSDEAGTRSAAAEVGRETTQTPKKSVKARKVSEGENVRSSTKKESRTPKKAGSVAQGFAVSDAARTPATSPRKINAGISSRGSEKSVSDVLSSAKSPKERRNNISKTASAHKRDIQALKQDDPEFYKFLEENDATLLDFDDIDEDVGNEANDVESGSDASAAGDEPLKDAEELEEDDESEGVETAAEAKGDDETENDANNEAESDSESESENGAGDDRDSGQLVFDNEARSSLEEAGDAGVAQRRNSGLFAKGTKPVAFSGTKKHVDEVLVLDGCDEEISGDSRPNDKGDALGASQDKDTADTVGARIEGVDGAADIYGYSDSGDEDDDEDDAEAQAAAEAGIDLDVSGRVEMEADEVKDDLDRAGQVSTKKTLKVVLVDMAYLQAIKEQLKSRRSCLKAAKDLLRLFRAGRDILPSQTVVLKKDKLNKRKGRKAAESEDRKENELKEMEEDQFTDDGSFTSGHVKFASGKTYQLAMNLALTGLQDALDRMLDCPHTKKDSENTVAAKWNPSASKRWTNLQPVFRSFVFHMMSLCETVTDPRTLRFLLKRLERLVPYTRGNKGLLSKMTRVVVRVWSSDALHVSEATRLRSYLLLSKIARGEGNAEAVLRSCCNAYASTIASVCNPRTLPRIQFAATCIVELFGVDMGASYTTAFANLRELAVSLRAVLVSKDEREEVERIHNWSYINRLRLWSMVLGRYGSEEELRPLIYPYVQVALGVMRAHATPKTFPMRLHIASYLSDLIAQSGTFIPLTPHLLSLLKCSELRKKPAHGGGKPIEWRSALRVPKEAIKTKPFLSGVINGVVLQLAKFFAVVSKHVSFPELSHSVEVTLRRFSKEVHVPEWRESMLLLAEKLLQTSKLVADARAKADFAPHGAISPQGMLAAVPGIDGDMKTPVQRFYDVECSRVWKEEKLRDDKAAAIEPESGHGPGNGEEGYLDADDGPRKTERRANARRRPEPPQSLVNSDSAEEDDLVENLELDSDGSEE